MSDYNTGTQLVVLGFADQPGLVGKVVVNAVGPRGCVGDVVGGGSGRHGVSAVHQHRFVLRDGQFHPALGPNLASNHHQPKNIRFVTLALHSGPVITHHTVELNAAASTRDLDQFIQVAGPLLGALATQLINLTVGTNATLGSGQTQQFMAVSWSGVAKLIRQLGPTITRDFHILHPDGTVFVFTDGNRDGTEAFLRALDSCADHALAQFNIAVIILVVTIIVCIGKARQRGYLFRNAKRAAANPFLNRQGRPL
ncbi:hypothetical protein KVR01_009090 [Diaporthe batatas]|uniref:uncharacterized protein n=1 Tax=Diaporthe batatas TaxID=748121 RepID=UPI001D0550E2|nr:uncharacterized protein KVR01_009090 [Diaporthe batatas]KAG8160826.1 hypothetical protein KVR01_009090 [Diaporthe batatas]